MYRTRKRGREEGKDERKAKERWVEEEVRRERKNGSVEVRWGKEEDVSFSSFYQLIISSVSPLSSSPSIPPFLSFPLFFTFLFPNSLLFVTFSLPPYSSPPSLVLSSFSSSPFSLISSVGLLSFFLLSFLHSSLFSMSFLQLFLLSWLPSLSLSSSPLLLLSDLLLLLWFLWRISVSDWWTCRRSKQAVRGLTHRLSALRDFPQILLFSLFFSHFHQNVWSLTSVKSWGHIRINT